MDIINYSKIKKVEADLAQHKLDYIQQRQQDNLKVAKVEKDLTDYQKTLSQVNVNQEAKQKVTGYGTISLPKNTANGQVSDVVIKGLTATNLIKNGDFSNGITGWSSSCGTFIADDGGCKFTMTIDAWSANVRSNLFYAIEGHKYYIKTDSKSDTDTGDYAICAALVDTGYFTSAPLLEPYNNSNNEWAKSSGVQQVTKTGLLKLVIGRRRASQGYAVGQSYWLDNVMVIDLTATFGAGNEPTKEQCDQIFANYFDDTKFTVSAMRLKSVSADETETSTAYVVAKDEEGKIIELRSLSNGVKDEVNLTDGIATQNVSEDTLVSDTVYDSLDTTTYTNVDVVITTAFADAKAGTTGADGQTHYYDKDGVELTEVAQTDIDLEASVGKYYWGEDKKLYIIVAKGDYADIAAARTGLGTTSLTYQLAEPIETHVQVSGSLVSYPSGTIYVEPIVADAGIYTDKMSVLHQDLPIKAIEKLSKVDFITGLETELDVSETVIAGDKLSFTHPDLEAGDIVFFVYEYDRESTVGETEIEYYDSRYVVKDDVTEKFYKWAVAVADGVPSIELTEV